MHEPFRQGTRIARRDDAGDGAAALGARGPRPQRRERTIRGLHRPALRLALQLEASGIRLDDVGRAIGEKSFSLAFADGLFGRPVGMLDVTTRDMNDELSLSTEFVDDVRVALGATGAWDDPIREDDAELLRLLDRFVHQGLDERVAGQAAIRIFYVLARRPKGRRGRSRDVEEGVEEPLFAKGLSTQELLEAISAPGPKSQMLVDS